MRLYLDHNACSSLHAEARRVYAYSLEAWPHNPASIHIEGQRARATRERARKVLLGALGGRGQLIFTASATEANNLAIANLAGPVASSPLEHPSVRAPLARRAAAGTKLFELRHDQRGRIDVASVVDALDAGARSVCLMLANNELGNVNPIDEVAHLCNLRGVALHVDAVQVFGRLDWQPPEGVTTTSLGAHKAGGPVGIGALWLHAPIDVVPMIVGGHQERDRRAGTEDVVGAAAWAAVIEAHESRWAALAPVRDRLEAALVERLGAIVLGDRDHRLPNTTNVSIPPRPTEEILMTLDLAGVAVSGGSACSSGSLDVSPVIRALSLRPDVERSAIRISLGPEHVDLDVDALADRFERALGGARR